MIIFSGFSYRKPELIELLEYFSNSTEETADKASSDFVKKLDKELERIKNNPEFGGAYMSYQEKLYIERQEARQEGRQEGIQEGERRGIEKERDRLIKIMREQGKSDDEIKVFFPD